MVGVVEAAVMPYLKDCVVGLFKLTAHFGQTDIQDVFVDGLPADLPERRLRRLRETPMYSTFLRLPVPMGKKTGSRRT